MSDVYRIETASRRVDKEIADLPRGTKDRVVRAIEKLATEPRPRGSRKLAGEMRGAHRIRAGDYRVLYDVDDDRNLVVILTVLHRREVYRRL